MCNNAFLLSELMDNQSHGFGYIPSANHIPESPTNELISVQPLSESNIKFADMYMEMKYVFSTHTLYADGTIVLKRKRNCKPNNKLIIN